MRRENYLEPAATVFGIAVVVFLLAIVPIAFVAVLYDEYHCTAHATRTVMETHCSPVVCLSPGPKGQCYMWSPQNCTTAPEEETYCTAHDWDPPKTEN